MRAFFKVVVTRLYKRNSLSTPHHIVRTFNSYIRQMAIYSMTSFMNMTQTSNRIHPLLAAAAVSVTLVSLVGIAAITDILPKSHSSAADSAPKTSLAASVPTPLAAIPKNSANETMQSKPVVHHYAQAPAKPARQYAPVPSQPPAAPVAQNSPVGIGVGAVVGGLLGNQVGGGNGKTLATIAGALGGGYIGNEVAKKNQ